MRLFYASKASSSQFIDKAFDISRITVVSNNFFEIDLVGWSWVEYSLLGFIPLLKMTTLRSCDGWIDAEEAVANQLKNEFSFRFQFVLIFTLINILNIKYMLAGGKMNWKIQQILMMKSIGTIQHSE